MEEMEEGRKEKEQEEREEMEEKEEEKEKYNNKPTTPFSSAPCPTVAPSSCAVRTASRLAMA